MPQTEMWNYFMFASDMVTNTAWSAALGVTDNLFHLLDIGLINL